MTEWILIPCLVQLRSEFNEIAPDRAKGADGSVGDLAHQERTSDHNPDETGSVPIHDADHTNEVHALDITTDLNAPGLTLEQAVQFVLARCRSGAETRLRYIIFNRRIWRADNDWRQETYTLADPHTGHAHFSGSYVTAHEASTASWHLEDLVALTDDDVNRIVTRIKAELPGADAVPWSDTANYTLGGAIYDTRQATIRIESAVTALAGRDFTDEPAIAALVLAGLDLPALASSIADQVSAHLPDGVEVSPEQLQQAIVGALRELATPASPPPGA